MDSMFPVSLTGIVTPAQYRRHVEDQRAMERKRTSEERYYDFLATHNQRVTENLRAEAQTLATKTRILWGTGYTGI